MRLPLTVLVCAGTWALAGCVGSGSPAASRKGVPFDEMNLQNLIRWPSGRQYVEATGVGRPREGDTDAQARRKAARESAVMEAQMRLIKELEAIVPRGKIRQLLRRAEVSRIDYSYDDVCTVGLRIPKDVVMEIPAVE